jgi:hypothetical protein
MIRTARDLQSLDAALHCTQNFDDGVRREAEQTVRATLAFEGARACAALTIASCKCLLIQRVSPCSLNTLHYLERRAT